MKVGDMFRSKLSKSKNVDKKAQFFFVSVKTDYIERIVKVAALKSDEAVKIVKKAHEEDFPEMEGVTYTYLPDYEEAK